MTGSLLTLSLLLHAGEIAKLALKRGLIKVQGRTPEATMASAMYTDIKRKEDRAVFIRPHEGLFGLREWIENDTPYEVGILSIAHLHLRLGVYRFAECATTQRLQDPMKGKIQNGSALGKKAQAVNQPPRSRPPAPYNRRKQFYPTASSSGDTARPLLLQPGCMDSCLYYIQLSLSHTLLIIWPSISSWAISQNAFPAEIWEF